MEGKKPDNMDAGRYVCEIALVVLYANEDKAVTSPERSSFSFRQSYHKKMNPVSKCPKITAIYCMFK